MAKKFGFFNSINGDRKYLASDLSQAFDIGITTGLKQEEGNLEVVPYQGMQVQIQPGSAMIHGHFFVNDEPEIITLDVADAELNRIDRIVLRYDAYAREINTAVIKGTPAVNPNPPARLETPEQFDLVLADIYIPAAATEINQSNITDMRDSELCGYIGVKGAVSQLQFDAHLSENSGKHITESGANANGRYIKFDDGTCICYREVAFYLSDLDTGLNFLEYDLPIVASYSIAITNVTVVTGDVNVFNSLIVRSDGRIENGKWRRIVLEKKETMHTNEIHLSLFAIGRWK